MANLMATFVLDQKEKVWQIMRSLVLFSYFVKSNLGETLILRKNINEYTYKY